MRLSALIARRGKPGAIVSDNGTEFTSAVALAFAQAARVDWRYIAPGKPTQNAFAEIAGLDARYAGGVT